ncbi:MAG: glutamine amidotransferase [Planctomycetia bacterium]|nr:glutamine amidotransferase [Planctomycetia bacterium]
MTRLVLVPVVAYWAVALAALLLLVLWFWSQRSLPLSTRRSRTLAALRLGVILLVVAVLLRPTLVYTKIERQSATIGVLVDRSRSMLVADAAGNRTRWDELTRAFSDAWPAFGELAEESNLKLYEFDRTLAPRPFTAEKFDLGGPPEGDQTALGSAIADVLDRESGGRLAAIIVASDGAQRALPPRDQLPQNVARRLADQGSQIYTLTFGQPRGLGQTRDVAIRELVTARTTFVKNELVVEGTLQADGFPGQSMTVELLSESAPGKMIVVDSVPVKIPEQNVRQNVILSYIPETAGEFKLTLRVAAAPGELVRTNNEMSTFVTVLAGGLRVLYLEGAVRSEQKWIYRALDASQDIQLDAWRLNAQDPTTRPAELASAFQPGKYDVYIFGDLDQRAFDPAELELLATRVEEGAGLIMLGGFHSFGPGGYQGTKLNDVLPIEIQRTERQDFDAPIATDLHVSGEVKMLPTEVFGARHPIMALGPRDQNVALWRALPALEGANRFRRTKRGANVLAESEDKAPLLVEKPYGLGRVLAFAGDSTWRWALSGHEDAHRRFWRQTILWLARKDEATDGSVWIKLAERRFSPAARVEFTSGALDADGLPVTGAEFTARVTSPDGKTQSIGLARQGDQALGTFLGGLEAGDYTLDVEGTKDGKSLGQGKSRFLVFAQDLELDNPAADPASLASLAAMTGGRSLPPEQLPALLRELQDKARDSDVSSETKQSLWDNWLVLIAFVSLLATEWYLRKRWGLV